MRSHYDDFAASETNNNHNHNQIHNSSRMSSSKSNRSNNIHNTSDNNYSNGAIPYHARENSLPFSYGQISKTSTPLRPTTNNHNATMPMPLSSSSTSSAAVVSRSYKNGVEHEFDFDFDFGLGSQRNNNNAIVSGSGQSYAKTSNGSGGAIVGYNNGSGQKDVNYNLTQTSDRANFYNNCSSSNNNNNNNNNIIYSNARLDLNKRFNDQNSCTQTLRHNSRTTTASSNAADAPDASMIKAQPRLTSPLLVRKTLGTSNGNSNTSSRSPTRSNTIANTYHYSYGNVPNNHNNGSSSGSLGIADNFDKFGVNGNIHNSANINSDIYGGHREPAMYGAGGGGGSGGGGGDTLSKTPVRHDFDELLRERREKVFNEYHSTTHEVLTPKSSPLPPPRRFANGTVQLPSTLPPSLKHNGGSGGAAYPPQVPTRNQSSNQSSSKYNYDFQFNLNLEDRDDVDGDILRRRNQTLERSPQRQPTYPYEQKQQLQQSLYQTRDIPLASSYVEHNYHTISSSSATQNNYNNNSNNITITNDARSRETLSPTSMLDIYATPYDERVGSNRQPATNSANNINTTTNTNTNATILRSKRSDYSSTYGNGNMFSHEPTAATTGHIGHAMTDRESSPIYATSTKKVTSNAATYRSNSVNAASPSAAISTTTLYVADYPSPTSVQRPETPAFPVTPRTPYGGTIANGYNTTSTTISTNTLLNRSNGYLHQQTSPQQQQQQQQLQLQHQNASLADVQNYSTETIYGTNYRPRLNSSLSMANSEPQEVAAHLVKFAKDSSKFWYKPNLSREEAISLLLNAAPGTFVVRDSTTYKNAYGLVLRVAQPPAGTASTGKQDELVRHFLIEPTTRGVRLKGCANEPVFTSLSALVYEHSINQLALPCLLQIPERDIVPPLVEHTPAQKQLLTQGAACNVLWLYSCDTESLTGEEAIRKAIRQMYGLPTAPVPTEVHFKVSQQGITLTDNTRKKFFRKHYTADIISYCAIDPDHRLWTMQEHGSDNTTVVGALKKTIFAFVARRSASSKDNQCHIFCDLAITQPASAIVSFVNKTLPTERQRNYVL